MEISLVSDLKPAPGEPTCDEDHDCQHPIHDKGQHVRFPTSAAGAYTLWGQP